jgi:hypothetical protein
LIEEEREWNNIDQVLMRKIIIETLFEILEVTGSVVKTIVLCEDLEW